MSAIKASVKKLSFGAKTKLEVRSYANTHLMSAVITLSADIYGSCVRALRLVGS